MSDITRVRAILQDTSWALVVSDMSGTQMEACVNTSIRIKQLRTAGVRITHGGVLQGPGGVIPAMFIHNISEAQLLAIRETNPPLIICPQYLRFDTSMEVFPDLSTLSVRQGKIEKDSTKCMSHIVNKHVHVGMFSTIDLREIPKDDPCIPYDSDIGRHMNAFVFSNNLSARNDENWNEVERICNIRSIDMDECSQLFIKEAKSGHHTARTQRFRQAMADASKKYLKDPTIFGYRYKTHEGNYV